MGVRRLDWDGHELHVSTAPHVAFDLVVDGMRYARLVADAGGDARLEVPTSPSGHDAFAVAIDGGTPVGVRLGRPGLERASAPPSLAALAGDELVPRDRCTDLSRKVAVIVPVYNEPALVDACLRAVLAHSGANTQLIVIDDASPDPAIAPLLAGYAGRPGVTVLANPRNLGFSGTVNRGIAEAGRADVVLLNADAEPARLWLAGLRRAAYARDDIASATAVSDDAGAFSVPELEQSNPWPAGWTHADAARALWQSAGHDYPRLPTGNGFCLYLKRDALDDVGTFDAEAFPQGYGEENDWCQRAAARGGTHVIAGNVLVRHARSRSFGVERRIALGEAGMRVLRERWPNYEADVGATLFSHRRRVLDWRVRRLYAGEKPRERVLCCGGGITENREAWTFESKALRDGNGTVVERGSTPDAFVQWLQRHGIERVIGAPPPDIAAAALALGIPVEDA